MNSNWTQLPQPIIGLSPMDGISDAAFRYITERYGKPDILFTEFTSAEGISRGIVHLLQAFFQHHGATPTVGQIFGADPQAFYKSAFVIAEMGCDGVDINMGCPDKGVTQKNGGAALILQPLLAQEIVRTVRKATIDWAEGKKLEEIDIHENIVEAVKIYQKQKNLMVVRRKLPVSVKTRIGYRSIITQEWIPKLLETEPDAITLHGRTFSQRYEGFANWEEIAKAVELAKGSKTIILGNGDVKSPEEAKKRVVEAGVAGILIGRAALGNPWVFQGTEPLPHERLQVALEHCKKFEELTPESHFLSLRKHLAWYCKGFDGAPEVRNELMTVRTMQEVENILSKTIKQCIMAGS